MMAETLNDVLGFVDEVYGTYDHQPWWRGQSRDLALIPGVHRKDRGPDYEPNIANKFAQRAPTRFPNCPPRGALAPWLFLMQHYRLPTRLLDWTESFLTALFFAVENKDRHHEDGVIWALDPYKLNQTMCGTEGVLQPGHQSAKILIAGAFGARPGNTDPECLALITEEIDLRMLVQQSAFTIHKDSSPLNSHPDADQFVRKYDIPAADKPDLIESLQALGVRRRSLYPDLENLAADLREDDYRPGKMTTTSVLTHGGNPRKDISST